MSFKNITIQTKLLAAFFLVGILPFSIVGLISVQNASNALTFQAFEKLSLMQEIKKARIEKQFDRFMTDIKVLSSNKDIANAFDQFSMLFLSDTDDFNKDGYALYEEYHGKSMKSFVAEHGYHDLLLINKKGRIVFSAKKGSDLGRKVSQAALADSGLGKHFQNALQQIILTDYSAYGPANNEQIAFLLAPIMQKNMASGKIEISGVVALGIHSNVLANIMDQRSGMGETGDSFILTRTDKEIQLRSNSRQGKSGQKVSLEYAKQMFQKKSGQGRFFNQGEEELVSFDHLNIKGLSWLLVSKIDSKEAFQAVSSLRIFILIIGVAGLFLIVMAGFFISRSIIRPIKGIVASMHDIAEGKGDLTVRLDDSGTNELSELSRWFNIFIGKIRDIVHLVSQNASILNKGSSELSNIAQIMAEGTSKASEKSTEASSSTQQMNNNMGIVANMTDQASEKMNMVASATEQMTTTIEEIAKQTNESKQIANSAANRARETTEQMSGLTDSADEISQVTQTINDISQKINLLALNATIEAARAGEAGKGFAVVADEIKDLATQTSEATQDINDRVNKIQGTTTETSEKIQQIAEVIEEMDTIVSSIAAAVDEQSATTREIAGNISQASESIQNANEKVVECAGMSEGIVEEIAAINEISMDATNSSSTVNQKSNDQSRLAEELVQLVQRFKI